MNIMVFDTETVSVNKPFCYNIGYVIYNTDIVFCQLVHALRTPFSDVGASQYATDM